MSTYDRIERKIDKLGHSIEKKREKIHDLEHEFQAHHLSQKRFSSKRKHLQSKIRDLDSELRILKGGLVRKKHKLEKTAQ